MGRLYGFIFLVLYLKFAESRGMAVNYVFAVWYSYIVLCMSLYLKFLAKKGARE